MKTTLNSRAALDSRTPSRKDAAPPSCQPPPPPTQTVAENQHSQVTPAPHKRLRWTIVLAGVLVLLAGTLAAKRISSYRSPALASYNTCLAELDSKLSRALASQLRAAGFDFDAVIVSVEPPACRRAVCLVKRLGRDGCLNARHRIAAHHAGNGTWSFAGTGVLTGLSFDVDARAEMRRLAQSTPLQFPQVALAAPTPNQPKPNTASPFAQAIEVVLTSAADGQPHQWLDLEQVRCLDEPDWGYWEHARAYLDWCRTNGLDLAAVHRPDEGYWLRTSAMIVVPVEGKLWEQGTPDDITLHPSLRAMPQLRYHPISPADDQTDTYLFRTGEGTIGILRVLQFNQASRQVRIQYKLAHPGTEAGA